MKWIDDIESATQISHDWKKEQLLSAIFYYSRQVFLTHVNKLDDVFDLLSMIDSSEMKNQLSDFFDYERSIMIFKIEHLNWFETKNENEYDDEIE
jgi:hypothetical protein